MNVLAEQCATCIFRPGNLMFLPPGRLQEMVKGCQDNDSYIPCHEHMEHVNEWTDDEADMAYEVTRESPVCRGFFDHYPGVGQMIRIAGRLGVLRFVAGNPAKEARP